ncbi:hypothetical protein cypCar_00023627, partial [Cyprinus carpio]
TSQNVTLRGRYHCKGDREINVSQLCDFNPDCPQGDDEGEHCRQFLNGSYCSFGREDCNWQLVPARGPQWRAHPSIPQSLRSSCPSPGALLAIDSQPKGQRGSAQVRSPLFFYPLRNAPCMVKFWVCGSSNGVLSLWIIENSTGPEGQRSLWNSTSEANMGKGWKLITLPLFGLVDLLWHYTTLPVVPKPHKIAQCCIYDNASCSAMANGEFPPMAPTNPTQVLFTPSNENIKTTTALYVEPGASTESVKWIFHTCGATGQDGPTPTQCTNSYRNTNVNVTVGTKGPFKGIQMWRVPETRKYRITAYGAAGGRSVQAVHKSHGVYMTGDFLLQKDELLYILVGQEGEDACPNMVPTMDRICREQQGPSTNKTQLKGGGGGGGGGTYIFKVVNGVHIPLLIAAGGGGRGYSSQSETPEEVMDRDPSIPGHNGKSGAAGGGGGWDDTAPVPQGGRPLILGGQGGEPCQVMGWKTRGGFGGGGGACTAGGGGGGYRGGSAWHDNDPRKDGDDGTSFISPDGEMYLEPLKGMEGDGEVIINPVQNCSHCESGDCHETSEGTVCYCDEELSLAADGVSCINSTVVPMLPGQPSLSHLALGLSVGTSALIAALLLAVSGVMIMYRRKHTELQSIQLELQSPDCKLSKLRASTIMTDYNPNYCFGGKTASINDLKEVPRRNISLTRGLGHGAFGEVYEGLAEHPSSLTMVDLLNIARDIARGCQYLEENQFIHRDIAARNCLLTCKGPGRVAKIGDFGMARDIYRASYYRKGGRAMLPVKWMPPEAFMEGIFTSKTDTWSFGVLLWEIFSLGYMPYPSRSNQEVLEFVTNGGRMDPPKNCPGPVYRIMTQSWQHQPEDRPNFSTILERIDYCLQDPDVVNVPLPVEYGPIPEEEERVPMRPEDPSAPSLLVTPQGTEDASSAAHSDQPKRDGEAVLMDSKLPPDPLSQPHPHHHHQPPVVTAPIPAAKPSSATPLTTQDGGHVNLGFMQAHPLEKESHNGKPTNLWNPTYGSWFLQQQQKRQQAQAQRQASSPRIPGEGQEQAGRTVTVAEALGLQQQHKQQQYQQQLQRQQQQGLCRPLLPPPAPTPLLLDSATLAPVPLYRLRRFPCGKSGYGYQEQACPWSLAGPASPTHPGQQRPISLARASGPEDSRPLLVTMGIVQDSRLPKMEGHNATVL